MGLAVDTAKVRNTDVFPHAFSNIYTLECSTDVKRDLLMYASIIETNRSSDSMPLRLYHPISCSDHLVKAGNRLHIECSRYDDDVHRELIVICSNTLVGLDYRARI